MIVFLFPWCGGIDGGKDHSHWFAISILDLWRSSEVMELFNILVLGNDIFNSFALIAFITLWLHLKTCDTNSSSSPHSGQTRLHLTCLHYFICFVVSRSSSHSCFHQFFLAMIPISAWDTSLPRHIELYSILLMKYQGRSNQHHFHSHQVCFNIIIMSKLNYLFINMRDQVLFIISKGVCTVI